jgi:RNA polymerase sigma-70 factor (ECF subfamily)
LLENELEEKINQSIENLPEDCRNVFKKSRFENKRYEQIAAESGISVNTVKYHIKNALAQLKKDLSDYL